MFTQDRVNLVTTIYQEYLLTNNLINELKGVDPLQALMGEESEVKFSSGFCVA